MKTLTITLHNTDNCGSSLQAFALQHYLLKNGIENQIIDYVPAYTKNNARPFRSFMRNLVFFKDYRKKEKKFSNFISKYLILTTKKWTSYEDLKANPPIADCYITGSDQLWNTMYSCGNDPAFYLFFTNRTKIAYAISMGRDKIPLKNIDLIKKYANDFKWISFREQSSVFQLCSTLNCDLDYVCDPVLLNPIKDYDCIKCHRLFNYQYILVYLAQKVNIKLIDDLISEVKKIYSGKIIFIGAYRNKCSCDINLRFASPEEFLSLIYNAECIISNSFHATMFSMMYKKQFMTIIPPENGERIKMILRMMGLSKQAIEKDIEVSIISNEEYEQVLTKLNNFSIRSQQLLKTKINSFTKVKDGS